MKKEYTNEEMKIFIQNAIYTTKDNDNCFTYSVYNISNNKFIAYVYEEYLYDEHEFINEINCKTTKTKRIVKHERISANSYDNLNSAIAAILMQKHIDDCQISRIITINEEFKNAFLIIAKDIEEDIKYKQLFD